MFFFFFKTYFIHTFRVFSFNRLSLQTLDLWGWDFCLHGQIMLGCFFWDILEGL